MLRRLRCSNLPIFWCYFCYGSNNIMSKAQFTDCFLKVNFNWILFFFGVMITKPLSRFFVKFDFFQLFFWREKMKRKDLNLFTVAVTLCERVALTFFIKFISDLTLLCLFLRLLIQLFKSHFNVRIITLKSLEFHQENKTNVNIWQLHFCWLNHRSSLEHKQTLEFESSLFRNNELKKKVEVCYFYRNEEVFG